jgi:hypothetical protein
MCGNAQTTFPRFVKPEQLIAGRPLTDVSLIVDNGIATFHGYLLVVPS